MKGESYIQLADFSGGINDSDNELEVRPNQLTLANNVIAKGKSVQKRKGFKNKPTTQSLSVSSLWLFELRSRDIGRFHVGLFGDGAGYFQNGAAWSALSGATGLNASAKWNAANQFIAGGTNRDALILTNYQNVVQKIQTIATKNLDLCEVITGWTASNEGEAVTPDSQEKQEGSFSLNMGSTHTDLLDACDAVTGWVSPNASQIIIDSCGATTGWEAASGSIYPTVYQSVGYDGGNCLRIGGVGSFVGGTTYKLQYQKSFFPDTLDVTNLGFYVFFYIENAAILSYIQDYNGASVQIAIGTDIANYKYLDVPKASLHVGWNILGGLISDFAQIGSPTMTVADWILIQVFKTATEIVLGQCLMDNYSLMFMTTLSNDIVTKREGSGSIKLGGNGHQREISTPYYQLYLNKTLGGVYDGTGKSFYMCFYIEDAATLAKLVTYGAECVTLKIGSSMGQYYEKKILQSSLAVGWNYLGGDLGTAFTAVNSPNITALDTLQIHINKTSDYLPVGKLLMDYFLLSENLSFAYTKDITTVDCTAQTYAYAWVYVEDTTELDTTAALKLYIGSDNDLVSNYYHKTYTRAALSNGWNKLGGVLTGWTAVGTPALGSIDILKIEVTQASLIPIVSGILKMDYWPMTTDTTITMSALGGTPPRPRYIEPFHN